MLATGAPFLFVGFPYCSWHWGCRGALLIFPERGGHTANQAMVRFVKSNSRSEPRSPPSLAKASQSEARCGADSFLRPNSIGGAAELVCTVHSWAGQKQSARSFCQMVVVSLCVVVCHYGWRCSIRDPSHFDQASIARETTVPDSGWLRLM